MKKVLFVLFSAGLFAACGPKPEATLDATVTGIADGTKVYLTDSQRPAALLDSTAVAGGKFRFEIAKAHPDQNRLQFEGSPGTYAFFVEPGAVTAAIDLSVAPPTAVFAGTPANDASAAFLEGTAGFNTRVNELVTLMSAAGAPGTPVYDSLSALYETADRERSRHIDAAILAAPSTVFAAYYINSTAYNLTTPEAVDSVLTIIAGAPANAFTDRLKERRELLAATAVGMVAPDFTQTRPDGTPFSLSSLKGKLVLIDFWASWCGPCRRENPNVVRIYNRFKDSGFEILGVSLDSKRDEWLKAIEDDGLAWIHVSDLQYWSNAVAKQYAVRSIPHTVLVGPDGVIVAKNLRGEALEAKIAEILETSK